MAVYFIQAGVAGPIKIGLAVDPRERMANLQTGHYERLVLLGVLPGDATSEQEIHRRVASSRLHGEWFRPSDEVLSIVAVSSMDVNSAMAASIALRTERREKRIVLRRQEAASAAVDAATTPDSGAVEQGPRASPGAIFRGPTTRAARAASPIGVEHRAIEAALRSANGDIDRAARTLGHTRRTLVARLRELGRELRRGTHQCETPA